MSKHFDKRFFSKEQVHEYITEQLRLALDDITKHIGSHLEAFHQRISELELANNSMIREMKEWKEDKRAVN